MPFRDSFRGAGTGTGWRPWWEVDGAMAPGTRHRRIDFPGDPRADLFDYWRTMVARLKLEPVDWIPREFQGAGRVNLGEDGGVVEMDCGPMCTY